MSEVGLSALEKLLRKYHENVRVRYNGGPPGKVCTLQLRITNGALPVRAKPPRYSSEKSQLLRRNFCEMEKLGLIKYRTNELDFSPACCP